MRREGPADRPDPAAQLDDAGQDVVARPAAEGTFVELVDLALDAFDEAEVVGDHLIGDGGHQTGGVHRPEARLALGHRVEMLEGIQRSVMDGHDPVVAGHHVERPANRSAPSRSGSFGGSIASRTRCRWSAYWVRSARSWLVRQALHQAGFQVDGGSDRREVVGRAAVEIDPQQLALADAFGETRARARPRDPVHPRRRGGPAVRLPARRSSGSVDDREQDRDEGCDERGGVLEHVHRSIDGAG